MCLPGTISNIQQAQLSREDAQYNLEQAATVLQRAQQHQKYYQNEALSIRSQAGLKAYQTAGDQAYRRLLEVTNRSANQTGFLSLAGTSAEASLQTSLYEIRKINEFQTAEAIRASRRAQAQYVTNHAIETQNYLDQANNLRYQAAVQEAEYKTRLSPINMFSTVTSDVLRSVAATSLFS